jgi:ubiquinone/menaquinone biosynthesis C-methylase UbiE
MSFSKFFSKQARKPSGIFGRFIMSRIFEKNNADLHAFIIELLALEETDHVLDIGFGTGTLIRNMANIAKKGRIEGIDFSSAMVSIAQKKNKSHIKRGRVSLRQGSFEEMSYDDTAFDKICTANTIYFWPDIGSTLKEILRILKQGGKLIIGFADKAQLEKKSLSVDVFKFYSKDEVKNLLINAGFSGGVDIKTKPGKIFKLHCAVAVK